MGKNEEQFREGAADATPGWVPHMGIFLYEPGRAELRSSIPASLAGRAERGFRGEVGMAQKAKPVYQTT